MSAGYGSVVVNAWLNEGGCNEFTVKYKAFAMDSMSEPQIQDIFAKLKIDQAVRNVIVGRATSCNLTPYGEEGENEEEEEQEEEEDLYNTDCTFLMQNNDLFTGCKVLE